VERKALRVRASLALKVFAAVFGTATLLVVALAIASVWRVDRSFSRYVQALELDRLHGLVETMQRERAAQGDWSFVPRDPAAYRQWFSRALGGGNRLGTRADLPPLEDDGPPPREGPAPDGERPPRRDAASPFQHPLPDGRRPPDRLALLKRVVFFDTQGRQFAGLEPIRMDRTTTLPIVVGGETLGYVGLELAQGPLEASGQAFVREQTRDMLVIGAAALLLSALVSMAFARHLRRPVRELLDGTRALTRGEMSKRLPAERGDEFGVIAEHFNQMAARLEQQERVRREWLASTSHELRTPLTVLRALIEALQEGIRRGDPATLQRLHDQVMLLSHLVDDLYLLAQHDAGQMRLNRQPLHPLSLVEGVIDAQGQRLAQAGIAVTVTDHTGNAVIKADTQRLAQLMHNLVENTLRYTDSPGQLQVTLSLTAGTTSDRRWRVQFDDSAPGVPAASLPRLFERFYRGEASRSRATGGSGLGLSICRAIAQDHGGQIEAQASPLGGLQVTLTLPMEPPR
jgi:two-component system sensor histidine kinase BaeS